MMAVSLCVSYQRHLWQELCLPRQVLVEAGQRTANWQRLPSYNDGNFQNHVSD